MVDATVLRFFGVGCLAVSCVLAVVCVRVFVRQKIREVYRDLKGANQPGQDEG